MSTAAATLHIPLETYLHTSYEPDVEYVDGELEERNVGEFDHNMIQRAILFWFYQREKQWGIRAIQEQRARVAETKVRLPGVSIFSRETPVEQVFTHRGPVRGRSPLPNRREGPKLHELRHRKYLDYRL